MMNLEALVGQIKSWGAELGFQDIAITDVNLEAYASYLEGWLEKDHHGEMHYMTRNHEKRLHPELLHPETCRVITARMDYLPIAAHPPDVLREKNKAYIARYALGRDYHKLIRKRLAKLAEKINSEIVLVSAADTSYRAFTDSAPVLEKALAEKAGLGWIGKNTLLMTRQSGSWFFLGEIFTNLPLPCSSSRPVESHCGACKACIKICPTNALVGPNQLDARKCISYLTIENPAGIPTDLRSKVGNRVFGCDDCQLICPWNRYAKHTQEKDFHPRHKLDNEDLLTLFSWDEDTFLKNTEGSAIRRIKHWQWQRNIAVGLGNGPYSVRAIDGLQNRLRELEQANPDKMESTASNILMEHIQWAISRLVEKNVSGKPAIP